MAKNDNLMDFLTDVANAIREKKGSADKINPQDFSSEILGIIAGDVQMPNVEGTLVIPSGITEDDYAALKAILGSNITIDVQGGIYIKFADQAVLDVLLANMTTDDGIGITQEQAQAVTSIGTWFKGNTEITSFDEFAEFTGVTTLATEAFAGCPNLQRIDMSNIQVVGRYAFYQSGLAGELNLPNATKVDAYAYLGSDITAIKNLGSITAINFQAFSKCYSLDRAIFPATVTWIDNQAMTYSTSVRYIIMLSVSPPTGNVTASFPSKATPVYVPDESVESYKTATNWSGMTAIKPMSDFATDFPDDVEWLNGD